MCESGHLYANQRICLSVGVDTEEGHRYLCVPRGEHKPKVIGFCLSEEWVGKVRDKRVSLLLGYLAQPGCIGVCVCVCADDVGHQNKTSSCFYRLPHKPIHRLSS